MERGFALILFFFVLNACSIINKFVGADVDPEQFDLARKARMLEVQSTAIEKQLNYIAKSNNILKSDFVFKIKDSLLNKLAEQYEGIGGWLDTENSFIIKSTKIAFEFGSASGSIALIARNHKYNLDVHLVSDCIIELEKSESADKSNSIPKVRMKLIPYNINVDVSSTGVFAYFKEIVRNLVKINLANLENNLPPIEIPIEFQTNVEIPSINYINKEKVNFILFTEKRKIMINIKIKDILFFDGFAVITANFSRFDLSGE